MPTVATVASVAVATPANEEVSRCPRVRYSDDAVMDVPFAPPATQAEVSAIYPDAHVEVLPKPTQRSATPAEAAELEKLVAQLLTDADDPERAEALTVALADPEDALRSFRALVNQR